MGYQQHSTEPTMLHADPGYQKYPLILSMLVLIYPQIDWLCLGNLETQLRTNPRGTSIGHKKPHYIIVRLITSQTTICHYPTSMINIPQRQDWWDLRQKVHKMQYLLLYVLLFSCVNVS